MELNRDELLFLTTLLYPKGLRSEVNVAQHKRLCIGSAFIDGLRQKVVDALNEASRV